MPPIDFHLLAMEADSVQAEAYAAARKHPPYNSPHEFYGVLSEEVYEFLKALHENDRQAQITEARQIAAVCLRFLVAEEERAREAA